MAHTLKLACWSCQQEFHITIIINTIFLETWCKNTHYCPHCHKRYELDIAQQDIQYLFKLSNKAAVQDIPKWASPSYALPTKALN